MRPLELTVAGFRSFNTTQSILFEQGAGLYRLHGDNGAGKSSIWDAMTWVLYGSTARGVRGASVVNWDQDERCLVELRFLVDGTEHVLFRARNSNELILDAEVVEQERVTELVGMDRDTFLQTVLMGQFGDFFFDKKPAERLALFSSIMELDFWADASKTATDWVKKLELQVAREEGQLNTLIEQTVPQWEGAVDRWKKKLDAFEAEIEEQIQEVEKGLNPKQEENLEKLRRASERVQGKAEVEVKRLTKQLEEVEESTGGPMAVLQEIREQISAAGATRNEFDTKFRRAEKLEGECQTCGQDIPEEYLEEYLEVLRIAIERFDSALEGLGKKKEAAEQKLEKVSEEIAGLEKKLDEAVEAGVEAKEDCMDANEHLQAFQREQSALKRKIEELSAAENPWIKELSLAEKKVKKLNSEATKLQGGLEALRQDLADVSFWPKGFKELRLWLIESALDEFSAEVNNALAALGLEDWSIRFEVERETKTGKISRGFNVLIDAPGCTADMPWEAWSGGETQRLRVAGAVGLASLIRAKRGLNIPFEVWDEPTAHLTEEGVDDLIHFFHNRARQGMEIWIVDHRSTDSGLFAGEILATKTKDGTCLD